MLNELGVQLNDNNILNCPAVNNNLPSWWSTSLEETISLWEIVNVRNLDPRIFLLLQMNEGWISNCFTCDFSDKRKKNPNIITCSEQLHNQQVEKANRLQLTEEVLPTDTLLLFLALSLARVFSDMSARSSASSSSCWTLRYLARLMAAISSWS